jgi:hypothetical protein
MADLLVILVSAIFVNNFVLARFLGICPFLGVSKKVETALGMGMAVTFVMTVATVVTWFVQYFVLIPFGIEYLQTIAFILVIASLVQLVEMVIQKVSPVLYQSPTAQFSAWPFSVSKKITRFWRASSLLSVPPSVLPLPWYSLPVCVSGWNSVPSRRVFVVPPLPWLRLAFCLWPLWALPAWSKGRPYIMTSKVVLCLQLY